MKQRGFLALSLVVFLGFLAAFPVSGDERDTEYRAYVIAAFGGTNVDSWVVEGNQYESKVLADDTDPSQLPPLDYENSPNNPSNLDDRVIYTRRPVLTSVNGTQGVLDEKHIFKWKLAASRFATVIKDADGNVAVQDEVTQQWPKQTYVPRWPQALFGANPAGPKHDAPVKPIPQSFGVWGRFDRQGYNWIDMYLAEVDADGNEVQDDQGRENILEIPFPGRISSMNLWVWGSNLRFYIEAYVRDHLGIIHAINLGNIDYTGWKNLRASIPASIPQGKRIQPNLANLKFVKFRIWTTPGEQVGNFYIYFNQFKVLADVFESLYDGDDLAHPERVDDFWKTGQ